MPRKTLSLVTFTVAILVATPALAHPFGVSGAGIWAGLGHPLGGLDHLLAMVAVGLWAVQLGGRALWALPVSFVAAMAAGACFALAGIGIPAVELGVAGSVVLLGLLVAGAARVPVLAGCGMVAVFALFHGHAHGTELPAAASPALYGLGFVLATAALHAAGIGLGRFGEQVAANRSRWSLRAAGAAAAATGVVLLAGV